jgi:cellulose synthase (UDP-forming)
VAPLDSRSPAAPPPERTPLYAPGHPSTGASNGGARSNGSALGQAATLEPMLYGRPIAFPRWRVWLGRLASLAAIAAGAFYLSWRVTTLAGTGGLGTAFFAIEAANYVSLALTALLLWHLRWRTGPTAAPHGNLDVFVPVCGEPVAMVEETLRAALAITYPHGTYILNDGRRAQKADWESIDALARRYGVPCFTRTTGARGKAGNLNHALPLTDGDFVAVIDADHRADPRFAHETLGYFEDTAVGFVCTPQQFEGDNGDVLGNRELLFYTSMQPAKDAGNSAFSCGNAVVYRRDALESVRGFSEWSVVEDVHTSLELHARGWRSVYHPRPLTTGTAPQTAGTLARQRLRWAVDSLRILFWRNPLFDERLSLRQRLHYFQTASFYLVGATQTLFVLGPVLYLLWGVSVMRFSQPLDYVVHGLPYYASILLVLTAYGGLRGGLRVIQQQLFLSPVYCLAVMGALAPFKLPAGVTDKARRVGLSPLLAPQLIGAVLCGVAVVVALRDRDGALTIAGIWAALLFTALTPFVTALGLSPPVTRALRIATASAAVAAIVGLGALPGLVEGPPEPAQAASPQAPASRPASTGSTSGAVEHTSPGAGERPRQATQLAPPAQGAYVGFYSPEALRSDSEARRWGARYDVGVQIVSWYQQWLSGETRFRADWLDMVARQGAVPMITWEPWRKPPGQVHTPYQPEVSLSYIASGRYDRYIRSWARAAAAYRRPILLRFMHEMNGTWYPWAITTNGNSESTYVAAWRHVHDLFAAAGASNVSWVWTINSFPGLDDQHRDLAGYYPGDAYVDWVSVTGFNWGDSLGFDAWRSVDEIFAGSYNALTRLHKPIMVSEIGTVADGSGDPARWIRRALSRFAEAYPQVKAVVWFDSPYPGDADFRLEGNEADALRAVLGGSRHWGQPLRLAAARPASG